MDRIECKQIISSTQYSIQLLELSFTNNEKTSVRMQLCKLWRRPASRGDDDSAPNIQIRIFVDFGKSSDRHNTKIRDPQSQVDL